jgi:putative ABC transport system permease protein
MFKLTRRSLWEHKRRLVLTLVAIMLGVGFMAGTFVLSDTMDQAFDDLFAEGSEKVDAQVQGEVLFSDPFGGMGDQRKLLDASLLDQVRAVDGVAEAEPFVITIGFGASNRVLGSDGEAIGASQGPPTLIENWYDNDQLSAYDLTQGRGPESDDEIALNVAAVEEGEFRMGGPVEVLTQFGPKTYTLVGQFLFGTAKSSAGAISADFTLAEAQRLAGTEGQIQQVVAKAEEGISQEELVQRIAAVLPDGAEVITGVEAGEQLSSDVQSGFAFFQTFLSIFGGVALLVGVFVISNTFSILVAQRTRELALLRAVGARRGQILRSVLVEAVMVGLIGAGLGLGFGLLLASGVTAAFESAGADLPTEGLQLRPATVIIALLIGLVVTLVASISPALKSTRVPPLAALRDVAFERPGASRVRIAVGLVALAVGAFNLTAGWRGGSDTEDVPVVGFGAVLLILSAIVVGPVLAGPTVRAMGRLLPRFRGVQGRLATENAARSPKRTSATASALIIGVALVGLISIFASSAQASIGEEVSRGFEGDFAVQASGGFAGPSSFPPVIADQVAAVPGVEAAVGLGFGRAEFTLEGGKKIGQFLSAVDPAQLPGVLEPRMTEGEVGDLTDDGIIVDVGEADDHGIAIGDTITVTFAGGKTRELTVESISDEENLLGYYTITRATFLANQHLPGDFMVFGKSEPGSDLDEVMARIDRAIEEVPTLEVVDRDGFIGNIADQITQFVTFIYALLALSVLIAAIGIANTLSLAIHERTRELGLLRAVGMNRSQLRSSIRWEAILIALLGTVVGIVLAIVVSRSLLQSLHSSGLITYRIPVGSLVLLAVMAGVVGVLASFFPSRRAARMAILDAIAKS